MANETLIITRPGLMKLWFNTHRPTRVVPVESNWIAATMVAYVGKKK
jgi:hypothetical protein